MRYFDVFIDCLGFLDYIASNMISISKIQSCELQRAQRVLIPERKG